MSQENTEETEKENLEPMAGPSYNHQPRVKFFFL